MTRGERAAMAYHAIAPTRVARVDLPSRSLSAGYSRIPGHRHNGFQAIAHSNRLVMKLVTAAALLH